MKAMYDEPQPLDNNEMELPADPTMNNFEF